MNQFTDHGLNVNASPWSGPASLNIPMDENPAHAFKSFSQPSSQMNLFPPSVEAPSHGSRQICKFFLSGGCSRGDACPFLHELPKDSNILDNNDSMTSVTGIVFNLNAKNTFSALQNQNMSDGADGMQGDRDVYSGDYSPMLNDLSQDYYPSYLQNDGYSFGDSWSNQLTSEVPQGQYDTSRGIPSYSPSDSYAHGYPAYSPIEEHNFLESGGNEMYWAAREYDNSLIEPTTQSFLMESEAMRDDGLKGGPLSYAAVAQKKKMLAMGGSPDSNSLDRRRSPLPENLVDGSSHIGHPYLESSESTKRSPVPGTLEKVKSPSPGSVSPVRRQTPASDDIEPQWKPISKFNAKMKHHDGKNPKQPSKARKNKETDTDERGQQIEHSTPHKSMSSHKIQLPIPTLWPRRSIPEVLKRPMHVLLHTITESANEEPFSTSAENEYLKTPVDLNLDAMKLGTKPHSKQKTHNSAEKNLKGARKQLHDGARDGKNRPARYHGMSSHAERGRGTGLRGRGGYGGQAYHENRMQVVENK